MFRHNNYSCLWEQQGVWWRIGYCLISQDMTTRCYRKEIPLDGIFLLLVAPVRQFQVSPDGRAVRRTVDQISLHFSVPREASRHRHQDLEGRGSEAIRQRLCTCVLSSLCCFLHSSILPWVYFALLVISLTSKWLVKLLHAFTNLTSFYTGGFTTEPQSALSELASFSYLFI